MMIEDRLLNHKDVDDFFPGLKKSLEKLRDGSDEQGKQLFRNLVLYINEQGLEHVRTLLSNKRFNIDTGLAVINDYKTNLNNELSTSSCKRTVLINERKNGK